jgi:hypothetical protein
MKTPVNDALVAEYARRLRSGEPLGQVFPFPMSECEFTHAQREAIRLARAANKPSLRNGNSIPKAASRPAAQPKAPATKAANNHALTKLARLLYLQSGRCFFCGEPLSEADASIEHLNPMSRGGTRTEDNEVVCHKSLNQVFGDMNLKSKFAFILKSAGSFKCPPN